MRAVKKVMIFVLFLAMGIFAFQNESMSKLKAKYSDYFNKFGLQDRGGYEILAPTFDDVLDQQDPFFSGYAVVKLNGAWGYITEEYILTRTFFIEPQFEEAFFFGEDGIAIVKKDGKYGYITKDFKFTCKYLVEPQFDYASRFSEDLAAVLVGEKWGFISKDFDLTNTFAFEPQFEHPGGYFSGGEARLGYKGKVIYLKKDGSYRYEGTVKTSSSGSRTSSNETKSKKKELIPISERNHRIGN